MSTILNIYNQFHLGDNIFSFILFYNIKNYIENNNIIINYYCLSQYHKQLLEFKCSDNINLLSLLEPIGINIWIGNTDFHINHFTNKKSFNLFYVDFFNQFLSQQNLQIQINNLEYTDPELLIRYDKLDDKYKNIQVLIINSDPLSGQYTKNEDEWNEFIINMNNKYNIVTTKKFPNIVCTLDNDLSVKDIASLSIKCDIIIAINTGIVPPLFNTYTLNNVKDFYYFDNNIYYSYEKFKKINHINELNFLYANIIESFKNESTFSYFNNICLLLIILLLVFTIYYKYNLH